MSSHSRELNYQGVFDTALGLARNPPSSSSISCVPTRWKAHHSLARASSTPLTLRSSYSTRRAPNTYRSYTQVVYDPSGVDGGLFFKKVPSLKLFIRGEPLGEIDPRNYPHPSDLIVTKQYPSCFFGTSLGTTLKTMDVDTIVLIGCSTSGCVRATAVDGIQYGYRVVVPRECVGDRHDGPHDASLFDINAKYGDVVSKAAVIEWFNTLKG